MSPLIRLCSSQDISDDNSSTISSFGSGNVIKTTPSTRKKSVRFSKADTMRIINKYTDTERKESFYTQNEYRTISQECYKIVERTVQKEPSSATTPRDHEYDDDDSSSLRGLERFLSNERIHWQRAIVVAVVKAQDNRHPTTLASLYRIATTKARHQAREVAAMDAEECLKVQIQEFVRASLQENDKRKATMQSHPFLLLQDKSNNDEPRKDMDEPLSLAKETAEPGLTSTPAYTEHSGHGENTNPPMSVKSAVLCAM